MEPLEILLAIEEIRRLKGRYFRCLDTKDWDGWAEVFTEDATLQFDLSVSTLGRDGLPSPKLTGRAEILAFVARDLATAQTVHHGHTPEIEITGETAARGVWAMQDVVDHGEVVLRGCGHYRETYRKEGGAWRIASSHLTRLSLSKEERNRISLP